MSQIDKQLYQDTQALIEIWEAIHAAMYEKNLDVQELSIRTKIPERELEDCLYNYADAKLRTLFKIAGAVGKVVNVRIEDV